MYNIKQKEFSQSFDDQEKISWMRLSRSKNVGTKTMMKFLECYGSVARSIEELSSFSKHIGKKIQLIPEKQVLKEISATKTFGAEIILPHDKKYPKLLLQIEDFPLILTVKGDSELLNHKSVAIVGSRNCSLNGKKYSSMLATKLASHGFCVTSGLAAGIDTAAHIGALSAKGKTIAVIAGGIDHIYPKHNVKLYEEIANSGLLVSETPFGVNPIAQSFPRRNRIISGLSLGVVVVEATKKSGSLVTARMALEQNRDVFAVPGHPLDVRSEGTNLLLKQGAKLVEGADDIIAELGSIADRVTVVNENQQIYHPQKLNAYQLHSIRDKILNLLTTTPVDLDDLYNEVETDVIHFQQALVELELAGAIVRISGTNQVCLG